MKDVANSLAELMNAARITSGKNSGDEAWESLKNCAKVSSVFLPCCEDLINSWCLLCILQGMVTKVSALLKTVKSVEDEAGRGVRLLESTIDRIDAELKVFPVDEVSCSGHF